jgi:hypothetical protein
MQNPTDQAEAAASIPSEATVTDDSPNMNRTVQVRRKAAKRTRPFDLSEEELHLMSSLPPPPQAEDIPAPARKKRRIEEPLSTTTVSVGLPAAVVAVAAANVDPMMDTQPNAGANRRWTLEESTKLTHACTNTSKKKRGKENSFDWDAIAELVPGRTKAQCRDKWHTGSLNPNIDPTTARAGKWSGDEIVKLKDAVQMHGGKNWSAIVALIPGRTLLQCRNRWYATLTPSIVLEAGCTGKWSEDEVTKLKDAVQMHGGKSWKEIAALVSGRTSRQCSDKWSSIALEAGCTGKWSEDEVTKLKDAVLTHGDKNWKEITSLVPGRTSRQCSDKWRHGQGHGA